MRLHTHIWLDSVQASFTCAASEIHRTRKEYGYRPRTNQITRTWVIGENGDNYTMSQWSGTIVLEKMVSPSLGKCQIANGMRSKGQPLTNDYRNCYCKCPRNIVYY